MQEDEIKKLFGKKIKYLRNNLGLTQFMLGEKANINQRQVALIEAGKSFPSLKTIINFSNIFSCKIQDLFSFDNYRDEAVLREELSEFLLNLNSDKIRTIYTIAKELI